MVRKIVNKIVAIARLISIVDISIGSPIPRYLYNIYSEKIWGDLGIPVKGAIRYGNLAKACVPNTSIILIFDLEKNILIIYNMTERIIQLEKD
jgi:hypothetical protein